MATYVCDYLNAHKNTAHRKSLNAVSVVILLTCSHAPMQGDFESLEEREAHLQCQFLQMDT